MSGIAERWDERLRSIFGLAMLDHPARLEDGIRAAVKALELQDEAALLARIDRGDHQARSALARALTVGETYFFRERLHLDHFRDELLPAAIARGQLPVTVVSAGCSSGEEAYTLAMLAREKLGEEAAAKVRVLGFDLNPESVASARRGVYRPWSLRGMTEPVRRRWFDDVADGASVKAEVRSLVRFEERNMVDAKDALEPASADIVFCRNVLIYFDDASVKTVLFQLARGLRTGGTLVVGSAEAAFFAIAGLEAHPSGEQGTEMWMHTRDHRPKASLLAPSPRTPPPIRRPPPRIRSKPTSERTPRVAPPPPPPTATSDILELLDRGWKALAIDPGAAGEDARRALLLDRTVAGAHVLAASAALAQRDLPAARRSLRNARRYLATIPATEVPSGGGGATAAELSSYCARLERALGGAP